MNSVISRMMFLFVLTGATAAQAPPPPSGNPWMMTPVNGDIIFAATTAYHGRELWRYSPRTGITEIVADINPQFENGFEDNGYGFLASGGGGVLFLARQHQYDGLWRSDGTAEGTKLILRTGLDPLAVPTFIDRINNISLLRGKTDSGSPYVFAVTDAAEIYDLPDAKLGTSLENGWIATHGRKSLIVLEKQAYTGYEVILGVSLTDGTIAGTRTYPDSPLIGKEVKGYFGPVYVGQSTYFLIESGGGDFTLWQFDDAETGPHLCAQMDRGFKRMTLVQALGERLLLTAKDAAHGNELWRYDLPSRELTLLADIFPGPADSDPYHVTPPLNDEVLFSAVDDIHGRELWKTDGTPEGTRLVVDLYPGAGDAHPYWPRILNGRVVFGANSPRFGEELWSTDGTEAGTRLVKDINPGKAYAEPYNFSVVGNLMYFSAITAMHGCELWVTDGTSEGTWLAADINRPPGPRTSSRPRHLHAEGGKVYFVADERDNARALWKSDGSSEGTVKVTAIPGNAGEIADAIALNGTSYAIMRKGASRKLWRLSESGCAELLKDGARLANDTRLVRVGDALYFAAATPETGCELWRIRDGATMQVTDLHPGTGDANPQSFHASDGRLFFSANDGGHGDEPWVLLNDAPSLLADIAPGSASSSPREFTVDNAGAVYVVADDGEHGPELWRMASGTEPKLLRDIFPIQQGDALPAPTQFVNMENTLFFTATDGVHGVELWATDGTPETTRMVRDITTRRGASSFPRDLTAADGQIYFSAYSVGKGRELWRSDGTENGTYMVVDNGGKESSGPEELIFLDDVLCYAYFKFSHAGPRGREFNAVSPLPYIEVRVGEEGSYPEELTLAGDKIYFRADDGWHGEELWAFEVPTARLYMVRDLLPDASPHLLNHVRASRTKDE